MLKKPVKKTPVSKEKIPMFHDGDAVKFDDGTGTFLEGVIESVDNDNEVATVLVNTDQYEVEFKELTAIDGPTEEEEKPAKKVVKKTVPAKGAKKGDAFAEKLRQVKAAAAGGFLADGEYEGLVVEINYKENEEKGDSVGIKYTVVNNADEDLNGKSTMSFYNVTTPEGDLSEGVGYLRRDLNSLGLDEESIDGVDNKEEFIELLEKLAEDQIWVEFKVATRKGFSNVFLTSVFSDQSDKPALD